MAVITISKEFSSGGVELGQRLAQELGCVLVGKAMLARLAEELGLSQGEAELLKRGEGGGLMRLVDYYLLDTVRKITQMPESALDNQRYCQAVKDLVTGLAAEGNVIILGWGGQCILAGRPEVVHVRVVAPLAQRAQRLAQEARISLEQATSECRRQDGYSAQYVQHYFQEDWADPNLYHLTINHGLLDFDLARSSAALKALL